MENPVPAAPALTFLLQQESGELIARYDPSGANSRPDLALLIRLLGEQGFGDFLLPQAMLRDFIERTGNSAGRLEMPIGRRCDGEFKLSLDDDSLNAHLTLNPPQGGSAVPPAAVWERVRELGIIHGLRQAALDAALTAGSCEQLCIASGDAPIQGTPGRFESLLVDPSQQLADANEDGNYNDLCHLMLVRSGAPLMRRIAPIDGIDGTDLKGAQIVANPIPEIAFATNLEGTAPDPEDPDLLLATQAGQPVVLRSGDGVYINKVLEVPVLDPNTGNIVFEGTIRVQGDVKSGMHLKVTGDVIVIGTVEAAEIIAGGNVAVHGGIIGHGSASAQPGGKTLPANTARIRAQGTVQALFIEHAHIEAGDSIHIAGHARQSEMVAGNAVLVGQPGAKNSNIAGCTVQATLLVRAPVLGSASGMQTSVQVGSDPYLAQAIATQESQLQAKLEELENIRKLLAYLKQNPQKNADGMGAKAQATFKQLVAEIQLLITEKAELGVKQKLTEQARIEVSHTLHEGVELRIGKQVWSVHESRAGGTVLLENGLIVCN